MKKLLIYGYLILNLLAAKQAFAPKNISFTYSKDSRDYSQLNINGLSKLPYGLITSGFMDIDSKPGSSDLSKFYLEPRIAKAGFLKKKKDDLVSKILNSFGFIAEYNGSEKDNDDKIRAGIISNNKIKEVIVNFKYLPLNTKKGQQLSVFLKKSGKDWYVNGFVDYNIIDGKNKIFSEFWGGHEIKNNLYGILEIRLNQFLKENQKGIAVGLEYKF